jgi:integrase
MKKVDKKFADIHPHYFRHYWNEGFSEKVDTNNKLAASGVDGYTHIDSGKEAKMRKHQMGHSSNFLSTFFITGTIVLSKVDLATGCPCVSPLR